VTDLLKTLKTKINLHFLWSFDSYLTGNTGRLQYKNGSASCVQ